MSWMCRRRAAVICLCVALMVPTFGCGTNPYQRASVTGRVLCGDKPAEGGTVVLRPIDSPAKTGRPANRPGSAATGTVEADGSFSLVLEPLGSDRGGAGALTGPHEVIFRMPPTSSKPTARSVAKSKRDEADSGEKSDDEDLYDALPCGRAIWPDTVDVKPGSNVFNFVLLPKSFDPKPVEKRRGHGLIDDHIKVDPSTVDPALIKTSEHAN